MGSRWLSLPLVWLLAATVALSCRPPAPPQPLYTAGTERDDGHGLLARASTTLMTDAEESDSPTPVRPRVPRRYDERFGGDTYGSFGYGGDTYGDATYASYIPPPWGYPSVNRAPRHRQQAGLSAAIEGTVTWRGGGPKLATACGPIEVLGGALVYIESVTTGRVLLSSMGEQRPAVVGGVVVKRGCNLAPAVQVVNPIPAQLAIHGDAKPARLAITEPGVAERKIAELEEAGRVALQIKVGVTRVEAADGSLGAAWVVGVETPYFAVTDDAGRFRIDELAPGTYDVTIWMPPVPAMAAGKLVYGPPNIVHRTVTVSAAKTTRLDVTLGK